MLTIPERKYILLLKVGNFSSLIKLNWDKRLPLKFKTDKTWQQHWNVSILDGQIWLGQNTGPVLCSVVIGSKVTNYFSTGSTEQNIIQKSKQQATVIHQKKLQPFENHVFFVVTTPTITNSTYTYHFKFNNSKLIVFTIYFYVKVSKGDTRNKKETRDIILW